MRAVHLASCCADLNEPLEYSNDPRRLAKGSLQMPLLVTSAARANGNGCGTLLAYARNARPLGAFSDDSVLTVNQRMR